MCSHPRPQAPPYAGDWTRLAPSPVLPDAGYIITIIIPVGNNNNITMGVFKKVEICIKLIIIIVDTGTLATLELYEMLYSSPIARMINNNNVAS